MWFPQYIALGTSEKFLSKKWSRRFIPTGDYIDLKPYPRDFWVTLRKFGNLHSKVSWVGFHFLNLKEICRRRSSLIRKRCKILSAPIKLPLEYIVLGWKAIISPIWIYLYIWFRSESAIGKRLTSQSSWEQIFCRGTLY